MVLHLSVIQPVKGALDVSRHKGHPLLIGSSLLSGDILVDHGQRVSSPTVLDESILVRVIEFFVSKKYSKSHCENFTIDLADDGQKAYRPII